MLKPGQNLGEYTIVEPISVGKTGQADVYLARHSDGPAQPIALKVLAEHLKTSAEALKNFAAEADILTRLNHPGIVRLESFDTSPPIPYIAQEYLQGQSLTDWLKDLAGPAPMTTIVDIGLQVADALAYAHGVTYFKTEQSETGGTYSKKYQGIIHRDLSTDNILLTKDFIVKLIDFGIAKAVGVTTITTRNTSLGKEYYVAPEVEIGIDQTLSPASDVYSFGVCLYELVMMHRPEKRRTQVLKQFQRNLHTLYSAFPDDIPEQLKTLICQCVQREPPDRPKSMGEIRSILLELHSRNLEAEVNKLELPGSLVASARSLRLARVVHFSRAEGGDDTLKLALNSDGTRLILLGDECTKVYSFNEYGGEKQTHYVPHGKRLAAITGGKDNEVFGYSVESSDLLAMHTSGEWRSLGQVARSFPKVVPDNLVYSEGHLFIGDYIANSILCLSVSDAQVTSKLTTGSDVQLGPFGQGGETLFFMDMASKTLFRANLSFQYIHKIATDRPWGWPIWLAVGNGLLFVVDSQTKSLVIMTTDGEVVDPKALSWEKAFEISQVSYTPNSSQIVVLHSSSDALYFFDVLHTDPQLVRLATTLHLSVSNLTEVSYETIEHTLLDHLRASPDPTSAAFRAITNIDNSPEMNKMGIRIQVTLYNFLLGKASPKERPGILRALAGKLEQLGDTEKAKQICLEYLDLVKGYDPEMRDKYGKLLEQEGRWEEIKEFEGTFLSQSYFETPGLRDAYSRSYNRIDRSYANLGIPLPKNFRNPPTAKFANAQALLSQGKFAQAREIFKLMIDYEDYKLLKDEDAIVVLDSYQKIIKKSIRLSLEDWEEIHRSLAILVMNYSHAQGYKPDTYLDMKAAENQIEKLKKNKS